MSLNTFTFSILRFTFYIFLNLLFLVKKRFIPFFAIIFTQKQGYVRH